VPSFCTVSLPIRAVYRDSNYKCQEMADNEYRHHCIARPHVRLIIESDLALTGRISSAVVIPDSEHRIHTKVVQLLGQISSSSFFVKGSVPAKPPLCNVFRQWLPQSTTLSKLLVIQLLWK
jgi:hypothetical protein